MTSSLIPEKPILIYPSLATTVGLDEAILLTVLTDIAKHSESRFSNGYAWYSIDTDKISEEVPFWSVRDIQRVTNSLRDKGILLIRATAFGNDAQFGFAFNEQQQPPKTVNQTPSPTITRPNPPVTQAPPENNINSMPFGKNYIAASWQPHTDTLAQLAQHSIPQQFALSQIPEFVTYWRDRGEAHRSWEAKFLQHVVFQWRSFEAKQHQRNQEIPMSADWRPSEDALDVLVRHAEISQDFIEDAIPEFILYWRERGDVTRTWNSKFIHHVRLQWKKYTSAMESDTEPKPIPNNWQPSEDVYDVLRLANIDLQFARELVPEFVIFWRDSQQIHTSWNTRFLQQVKRQWARQHAFAVTDSERTTREIPLEEKLTDRSWAQR